MTALVAALLRDISRYGELPKDSSSVDDHETASSIHIGSDNLAYAHAYCPVTAPEQSSTTTSETASKGSKDMPFSIDFDDTAGVQTRGKKAAKKAAKAAQQAKWFDSDNEGDGNAGENAGEDGTGGGGGDGGSGAGGAGGDDNGGNGDDADEWDLGGSKKKKGKKKKQEEEEKKKQEEEEKKKKEEEAVNATSNALSWADETNNAAAEDEWTLGFTSKKDKKKKGKKVKSSMFKILHYGRDSMPTALTNEL